MLLHLYFAAVTQGCLALAGIGKSEMIADHTDVFALAAQRGPFQAFIWTQPNCPWCERVKLMLERLGYAVETRDINTLSIEAKDAFKDKYQTVPQVFIHGKHVGGFDRTFDVLYGRV